MAERETTQRVLTVVGASRESAGYRVRAYAVPESVLAPYLVNNREPDLKAIAVEHAIRAMGLL